MFSVIEFIAGIGLFLFAMKMLEHSLKNYAGASFQKQIGEKTDSRIEAIFTGTIATAFLQSSSLVGLTVLALCGAGLLPLFNAIGVMLGANLGTTLTGWLVTFIGFKLNLGQFALLIVGLSALMVTLSKNSYVKLFNIFLSVGLLLLGLNMMKGSAEGLATQIDVQSFKAHSNWYFLGFGILMSAVIQSSSAVMMITLSALSIQVIELQAAGALVIGADLGTTSTVIIGSLRGAKIKRQLAASHLIFNLVTDVFAFIILLPFLPATVNFIGITDPLYSLVFFHSWFNIVGIILFFPWLKRFTATIENLITTDRQNRTLYIDKVPCNIPSLSLQAMNKEVKELLKNSLNSNARLLKQHGEIDINEYLDEYKQHKSIEGDIIQYRKQLQQQKMTALESEQLNALSRAARYAIFSVKSLKDIHQDIDNIYLGNREIKGLEETTKFFELAAKICESLRESLTTIEIRQNSEPTTEFNQQFDETLDNHMIELKLHYMRNKDKLYSPEMDQSLSSIEISTLLNLNREIYTSCKNGIKAVDCYLDFQPTHFEISG